MSSIRCIKDTFRAPKGSVGLLGAIYLIRTMHSIDSSHDFTDFLSPSFICRKRCPLMHINGLRVSCIHVLHIKLKMLSPVWKIQLWCLWPENHLREKKVRTQSSNFANLWKALECMETLSMMHSLSDVLNMVECPSSWTELEKDMWGNKILFDACNMYVFTW